MRIYRELLIEDVNTDRELHNGREFMNRLAAQVQALAALGLNADGDLTITGGPGGGPGGGGTGTGTGASGGEQLVNDSGSAIGAGSMCVIGPSGQVQLAEATDEELGTGIFAVAALTGSGELFAPVTAGAVRLRAEAAATFGPNSRAYLSATEPGRIASAPPAAGNGHYQIFVGRVHGIADAAGLYKTVLGLGWRPRFIA